MPISVWLFTLIQALAMSSGAMMVLVGGLLGAQLAPSAKLATLPVAMMIIGTAVAVMPLTRLMGKLGRKPVFIGAALVALFASLLAALAATVNHFGLFLFAATLMGAAGASFQQMRFAVMEVAGDKLAAKAVARLMLGGLVAAMLGPQLVTWGKDLTSTAFAGSFYLMAILCACCVLLYLRVPETHQKPQQSAEPDKVSIRRVLVSPMFIVAVSSAVIGYALMSFIMTATPVHMHLHDQHSLEHTKWVIQSHILAMFLPSFFSGWLLSRLGVKKVIIMGLLAYLLCIAIAFSGNDLGHYWVSLVLLGVGWNFLFLAGTVLLPRTHNQQQKIRVQSVNELLVFSGQGLAALGAGMMLHLLGWQGLLGVSLLIVTMQISLLLWQGLRLKSPAENQT